MISSSSKDLLLRRENRSVLLAIALLCMWIRDVHCFSPASLLLASRAHPAPPFCSVACRGSISSSNGIRRVAAAAARRVSGRAAGPLMQLSASATNPLDQHIQIDTDYPGIKKIYSSPDIYLIDDMLTPEECDSIISEASQKEMKVSPVAYAGWTEDAGVFSRLLPIGTLPTVNSMMNDKADPLLIAGTAIAIFAGLSAVFWAGAYVWAQGRTKELQALRTSTSVTLPGASLGDGALVAQAEKLLKSSWKKFEAPTVIRYEPGQVLAPHFDANRGADVEDANRGGQTLATLLVYLNEVPNGGKTAFGRLGPLEVDPKRGQGLLFFPAAADGEFDERVEHEGCRAEDEKWIARIWRHADRVPPPYGLDDDYKVPPGRA